jgi:hypothetical protein
MLTRRARSGTLDPMNCHTALGATRGSKKTVDTHQSIYLCDSGGKAGDGGCCGPEFGDMVIVIRKEETAETIFHVKSAGTAMRATVEHHNTGKVYNVLPSGWLQGRCDQGLQRR